MKQIVINRFELTKYSVIVDLSDEEANKLLQDPDANFNRLSGLCRATDSNWVEAEHPEFEVEEHVEE